ncbi:MAG: winged helix-turn-helix transcriptional regulator [Ignavibacteria bacterium]|nr:winged helix-turn-helix transcriptional regulator [Ignavibacteria bacterium]
MIITLKSDYFTKEHKQSVRFAIDSGHPVKTYILQLFNSPSCCFHSNISSVLTIAKSTLSQHLFELKAAGLIQRDITPPAVKYCIEHKDRDPAKSLMNKLLI